jgi:dihydropteroate synthase
MAAQVYLRPTGFVDSPFGFDGQVARLAGGLLWFGLIELIRINAGGQRSSELVPIEALDAIIDGLSEPDAARARNHWSNITGNRTPIKLGERTIRLEEPQVVGILNVTPDSFLEGNRFNGNPDAAAEQGFAMAAAGASIIDVGGESTRPGSKPVWEGDEKERVIPVVQRLASSGTALSVDTRKASVMEAALAIVPAVINDVSALTFDPRSADVVARAGAPIVLMHHQGTPDTMQQAPHYDRPALLEIFDWLEQRIEAAVAAGIERSRIIVDPGFGFGKTVQHNLQLLNGLALLHGLGCPLMFGASRKSTIGALSGEAPADQRLPGSLALALKAADQGAQLLRVHDVAETVQAVRVWRGLRDVALTPA